jgi:hypothetical protein
MIHGDGDVMQPLQTLTTAQRSKFWTDLPREWVAVNGGERMCRLGDFFEQLLNLLAHNPKFKGRKRDRHKVCKCRDRETDNVIYRDFWRGLDSHGETLTRTSTGFHNSSKWYLLLLPVTDDSIIHRIVRSLEKKWPDSTLEALSVAMVLSTLREERAVFFMFSMPRVQQVKQIVSVLGPGVIACTMLPKRVSKLVELFFNKNHRGDGQAQVTLTKTWDNDILEQDVVAHVAPMRIYAVEPGAAEAGAVEAGAVEAGAVEAVKVGSVEAGAVEAVEVGSVEAGAVEAVEVGSVEAGAVEAVEVGSVEAGAVEAVEAGSVEEGAVEAGAVEAVEAGSVEEGAVEAGAVEASAVLQLDYFAARDELAS